MLPRPLRQLLVAACPHGTLVKPSPTIDYQTMSNSAMLKLAKAARASLCLSAKARRISSRANSTLPVPERDEVD